MIERIRNVSARGINITIWFQVLEMDQLERFI